MAAALSSNEHCGSMSVTSSSICEAMLCRWCSVLSARSSGERCDEGAPDPSRAVISSSSPSPPVANERPLVLALFLRRLRPNRPAMGLDAAVDEEAMGSKREPIDALLLREGSG